MPTLRGISRVQKNNYSYFFFFWVSLSIDSIPGRCHLLRLSNSWNIYLQCLTRGCTVYVKWFFQSTFPFNYMMSLWRTQYCEPMSLRCTFNGSCHGMACHERRSIAWLLHVRLVRGLWAHAKRCHSCVRPDPKFLNSQRKSTRPLFTLSSLFDDHVSTHSGGLVHQLIACT